MATASGSSTSAMISTRLALICGAAGHTHTGVGAGARETSVHGGNARVRLARRHPCPPARHMLPGGRGTHRVHVPLALLGARGKGQQRGADGGQRDGHVHLQVEG